MKAILCATAVAGLAAASASSPLAARVQASHELSHERMSAAVRYALPHLLSGVRTSCAGSLAADGYLATSGEALQARFEAGSAAAWPQAKALFLEIGVDKDRGKADVLRELPDESLKPFIDGMLATLIATEIKPAQCADVERGLALIDPLPAENIAALVGFIIEMGERRKNERQSQRSAE